jgi:hypothetical protein
MKGGDLGSIDSGINILIRYALMLIWELFIFIYINRPGGKETLDAYND